MQAQAQFGTLVSDEVMLAHRQLAINTVRGGGDGSRQHVDFYRRSQKGSGKPVVSSGIYRGETSSVNGIRTTAIAFWEYQDGTRDEFDGVNWHRGVAGRTVFNVEVVA